MAKFQKLKPILEALDKVQSDISAGNTTETQAGVTNVQTLVKALKIEMVGEDGINYNYKCSKCGLNPPCKYSGGLALSDLTFCLDEYKTGIASWKFIDKSKGEV